MAAGLPAGTVGVARAFDAAARDYDATWGTNPVALLFRWTFQERLLALFPRGARVVDLGCGTGDDALFLAAHGVRVGAIDVSPAMIAAAQAKADARGLSGSVSFTRGSASELPGFAPSWDGAYSDFGPLNCEDVSAVAARLATLLRPGAPVLFSVMGRWPLPAAVHRAAAGWRDGPRPRRRPRS